MNHFWNFHSLTENLAGHYPITVNRNRRITFIFGNGDAVLVNYLDYYKEYRLRRMHNPPNPGKTLRENILPAITLTATNAAEQLGVRRAASLCRGC